MTSKSYFLYREAKKIIPGGNSLLSKRPEMWLAQEWPTYYKKAKGCRITSLEGITYFDFSTNGVGTCTLGYSNDEVNRFVNATIRNGNTSTLNSILEIELAKNLINLHPWAKGVRFSKGGAEALSIAIRIARNYTGKDKVIVSGYHGWQDWYLAANINSDELGKKGVHLKNLSAKGVPRSLVNTIEVVEFQNIEKIEKIFFESKDNVAAIVFEICRYSTPNMNYLKKLKSLAKKYNCLLIVDEVTTGFRFNLGGIHLKLDFTPDIAVYSKALGNGFPIAATVMNKKVFNAASSTFMSSSSWSESLGFAAAIASLNIMKELKSWELISKAGEAYKKILIDQIKFNNLPIEVLSPEISSIIKVEFKGKDAKLLKTGWCKLMLEKKVIDNGLFYPTVAHNPKLLKRFSKIVSENMKELKRLSETGKISKFKRYIPHETFIEKI